MQRLLIWDIDGTLMHCKGLGRRALNRTFEEFFGIEGAFDQVSLAGAVDGVLLKAAMDRYGVSESDVCRFFDRYGVLLEEALEPEGALHVYPGVSEILNLTDRAAGFYNIVGTGNCPQGAVAKLRRSGLDGFFQTGGYGIGARFRHEVLRTAHRNGEAHFNRAFRPEQVWVIGDTPADILAARENGYRALAVMTGGFGMDELQAHGPDAVLPDLTDADRVLQITAVNGQTGG